jgi:hypothetical protein
MEAYGVEMSKIPNCLESRLTVGGEVVSLTHRPHFTPRNIFWHSFLLEAQLSIWPWCGWKD